MGVAFVLTSGSVAFGEPLVGTGQSAEGTYVAVATTGGASSSQGVAASGAGPASGSVGGVSGLGGASGGLVAVSGTSTTNSGLIAVTVTGTTDPNTPVEVTGRGWAVDYPVEVEQTMIRVAKAVRALQDGECVEGAVRVTPSNTTTPIDTCTPGCVAGVAYMDLTIQPPSASPGCAGTAGQRTADGRECDACTGWNGMGWLSKGDLVDVRQFGLKNTSEETVDRQSAHGAFMRSRERWENRCGIDDEYMDQLWTGYTGDQSHQHDTSVLASGYHTGHRHAFSAASGHKWWDGGSYWVIENGETDMCLGWNNY